MAAGQNRNQALNPQARQALDQFKYEVASELGIQAPQGGYWGDIPSRLNGAVGGHMVRRMIAAAEQSLVDQAAGNVQSGFRQALQNPTQPTNQQLQGQQTPQNV